MSGFLQLSKFMHLDETLSSGGKSGDYTAVLTVLAKPAHVSRMTQAGAVVFVTHSSMFTRGTSFTTVHSPLP